jgi:transcriptional activator HAC1
MAVLEDQGWEDQVPELSVSTPKIKFEASPTESFLSTPGDIYSSLFATRSDSIDPEHSVSAMSPQSLDGDEHQENSPAPDGEGEKKPTKKRKSWGQVLPEPKTNLPPR